MKHSVIVHSVIYTLLLALLCVSLGLNWLFFDCRIKMDTEKIERSDNLADLFDPKVTSSKKK